MDGARLFSERHSKRTQYNSHKLHLGNFHLDVRKKNSSLSALEQVPREAVRSPSLDISKTQVDKALSNLIKV